MKYYVAAFLLASAPLHASGLADPVVEMDVIVAEAEADSTGADGLIVAIWLATVLAAAGGAF
ncbi:MAG: hypothetical protein AB8B82_01120 [Roseovarius sp.]